jgi:hypothetical protein
MAKKRASVVGVMGEAVSDVVDAVSVAATGSQLGVLELAAEEELSPTLARRKRRPRVTRKKRKVAKKSRLKAKKSRNVRRSRR